MGKKKRKPMKQAKSMEELTQNFEEFMKDKQPNQNARKDFDKLLKKHVKKNKPKKQGD